jgi:beta-lactamase regulating signal transducer with metallopeptidase domain/ketosteroid isomerase-like protein
MNTLTNPFVMASAKAAAWLLVWGWQAAVLLACVWAGLTIFRIKSPALRHQVWLFALIAVAAMPILSGIVQSLPLPQPNNKALSYAVELPRIVVTNEVAPVVQTPSPALSAKPSAKRPIILSLSFVLWLAGVCAFVMKATINGARLRRLRAGARLTSLSDLDCAECDCEALRAGKARLALSDEVRSPILLGVAPPMIVFPADVATWASPTERRAMLRHELAHVERRDHYVNLFQTVFGAVFFFHPLARYACRQLGMEREMACDDHVVGSGVEAESYAESIIKAAERSIAPIGALAGAPGGAHQLALFSARQILERRIEMILNKDRTRVIARNWKYLILSAALIAVVAWLLVPGRLTKSGLAQRQPGDTTIKRQLVKSLGEGKAFDELIDMAVRDPDAEMRRLAAIQLTMLEGDGSTEAMFELYNKSNDSEVKTMVIDTLAWISEIEPLTKIALSDPSPEFRLRALYRIKWLKETSDSGDVKAWDVSALQGQLNELSQDPPAPPPPPPPPPSSLEMTVESDKAFTPLRWDKDGDSVFVLLREIAYASMRRDTAFFERVLDDDYVGVGPDGVTRNKAEEIEEVKRLDSIKKFEFDDLRVSGNDDVAFATFLATVHFQTGDQDSTAQYRYTVNFIKRDVPLDAKVEAELTVRPVPNRELCLKCHSNDAQFKMAMAKVKERELARATMKLEKLDIAIYQDGARPSPQHVYIIDGYKHLKIAAIHMSRKQ